MFTSKIKITRITLKVKNYQNTLVINRWSKITIRWPGSSELKLQAVRNSTTLAVSSDSPWRWRIRLQNFEPLVASSAASGGSLVAVASWDLKGRAWGANSQWRWGKNLEKLLRSLTIFPRHSFLRSTAFRQLKAVVDAMGVIVGVIWFEGCFLLPAMRSETEMEAGLG